MKEKIRIENKNGPIRLEGNKFDSVLYLNNVPIQFTFIREIGTTWRYQIAKSISESDIIAERSFSNFVRFGYLANEPIVSQFKYIIDKLSSGVYQLKVDFLIEELYEVEAQPESGNYFTYDGYGGMVDIIETQSNLDEETVQEYIKLIEKGIQPIMIVLTCLYSFNKFILDGHHKFMAYSRLKKPPRALVISKLDCQKLSEEKGLSLFEICNCSNREYINRFLQKT